MRIASEGRQGPGRLVAALAAAAALALAATGCGVFGESVPASPGSFSACMSETGYSSSTDPEDVDPIARAAGVGAVLADIDGNRVTVVFESSDDDARRAVAAYEARSQTAAAPLEDVLRHEGPIVVVWEAPPSEAQRSAVERCLSAR